jgi:hypothetical protein
MGTHFRLDIDPPMLRKVAQFLGEAEGHMKSKAATVKATPDEIGNSWTGQAATSVKAEMTAIGGVMSGGGESFEHGLNAAQEALVRLASDYETALEDLAALNTRWDNAAPPAEADEDRGGGGAPPPQEGGDTRAQVTADFEELKERCRTKTKECGEKLALSSPIATYGYNGSTLGYSTNVDALLSRVSLTEQHVQQVEEDRQAGAEAASEVNRFLEDGDGSLADLLTMLDGENEAFRQGFIDGLDPEALRRLHSIPVTGDDAAVHGRLITAISQILAKGSNERTQPTYPPDAAKYDEIFEVYTTVPEGTHEELAREQEDLGFLLLSELVAAGQGDDPTWDSDLLASWARETFQHERDRLEDDEYWSWSDVAADHPLTTDAAKAGNWDEVPAWGDAVVFFNGALAEDPTAANAAYTQDGEADLDLLHHMYDRDGGGAPYIQHNLALGDALTAATSIVGAGGKGSPELVSAQIAADHVDYWANAEGDDLLRYQGLEQATTDILTQHVHAVNHAGTYGDVTTLAVTPYGGGTLPYEKIALANLDRDELRKVLGLSFGLDYFSNQISEDDGKGHSFPLYTQLATAMEIAARDDVIIAAQAGENGPDGLLERTVNTLSANQELANNAFRDGLMREGRTADEANADARAALDWTLGLVTDQVPVDRAGPVVGDVAGMGLDGIKNLVVDGLIPETDYEKQARSDVSTEDYRRRLTSLKLVEWLDDAGVLPEEHSPEAWAAQHPDASSFVGDDGEMPSVQDLYQNRNDSPADQQAWIDFKRYYENSGGAWLAEIDVDEQYQLGWIIEDNGGG